MRERARALEFDRPDARFKRDFLDRSFGYSCAVCDRLWFDNNLSPISGVRNAANKLNALRVLWNEFGRQIIVISKSALHLKTARPPWVGWRVLSRCRLLRSALQFSRARPLIASPRASHFLILPFGEMRVFFN